MRQLQLFLTIIGLTLTSVIYGQVDTLLCPNGATTIPDPKWRPIPSRFEIITELISGNELMELSQAFASNRDALLTNSKNGPIEFYWNFDTDEQFQVLTAIVNNQAIPQCFRQVIGPTSETSVIQPNTLIVKPSVLLGFDPRNQMNAVWGNQYIGDEDLRGIPTNKFTSCFYVRDIQATISATYYVSDPERFHAYLPRNTSIILQIDARIRNYAGREDSYKYNVFRYTPNPGHREELQALETPAGVYCQNRTSTLAIPRNLPDRVSANSEIYLPQANASIISTHGLYDTEFQFTRLDIWFPDQAGSIRWHHFTEIHDFAVGLSYDYNHTTRQCAVRDINLGFNDAVAVDGRPNTVEMGSPQHAFLLDDAEYQYTGVKRCRDRVRCHVWMAEKILPNDTIQHREMYWVYSHNGETVRETFPMKAVIKTYIKSVLVFTVESTTFNFRRNPMTIFEIDFALADCYRALGPAGGYNLGVLSFTIANPKQYPVLENLNYLRLHIFETLMFSLHVRPIRISNLIVDRTDNNDILVTFTLLDAPPRTGNVEDPLEEHSLDRLIDRLESIINANGLTFRARYDTKQVVLRARAQSLNTPHRSTVNKPKSSGPRITGLWLGFIVVGLVVGAIAGFIVFKKLAK